MPQGSESSNCAATATPSASASPVEARKDILDFLRGIAILGMLVANVPWHVGNSMSRVIEPDIASISAWLLQYLVFDQRFMPIFCFLFGAGFWILAQRITTFSEFYPAYLKRMLVLFCIGVVHAYLLWPGDILITYGVCGCLLLLFFRCSTLQLLIWGCTFKCISLIFGEWPEAYQATLGAWLFAWWVEIGDAPIEIAQAYAGSYWDLFAHNAWRNQFLQWTALPYFRIWNALGLMLLGIALYRMGVLQGDKPRRFYRRLLWISFAVSAPLIAYGVLARIGMNPTVGPTLGFTQSLPLPNLTFRTGCLIGSFSLIAIIHLLWTGLSVRLKALIQNVGRMALSNYLLQSLVFVLAFNTLKFFPFDSLDHDSMLMMVMGLWVFHLIFSHLWLSYFRQGPVEMLYRHLHSR